MKDAQLEEASKLGSYVICYNYYSDSSSECVLFSLESAKGRLSDTEDQLSKLQAQKNDLDRELNVGKGDSMSGG